MTKSPQEWLKQADYDINTAEIMFDNKRYFYAVCCEGYTFEEQGGVGMDKNAVLKILSRFRKALESKNIRIAKIILFCSYATGTYKEGSDIDVVVISGDFSGKDYWERIDIISDAIYEVFEPIEAVAMTPEEWEKKESPVVDYVKDGEVIYGEQGIA